MVLGNERQDHFKKPFQNKEELSMKTKKIGLAIVALVGLLTVGAAQAAWQTTNWDTIPSMNDGTPGENIVLTAVNIDNPSTSIPLATFTITDLAVAASTLDKSTLSTSLAGFTIDTDLSVQAGYTTGKPLIVTSLATFPASVNLTVQATLGADKTSILLATFTADTGTSSSIT